MWRNIFIVRTSHPEAPRFSVIHDALLISAPALYYVKKATRRMNSRGRLISINLTFVNFDGFQ